MKSDDNIKHRAFELLRFLVNAAIVGFFLIIWMLGLQISGGNALVGGLICALLFVYLGLAHVHLSGLKKALFPSSAFGDNTIKEEEERK